jgi:hypothetical protein
MHAATDVHDTAVSRAVTALAGVGALWTDQVAPFQTSTSGDIWFAPPEDPTAVHAVADEHDTPWSAAVDPGGTGMAWIDQSLPFQTSVRGARWLPASLYPTAVHSEADEHETERSRRGRADWSVTSGGNTIVWIDQLKPSQASASGPVAPAVSPAAAAYEPTVLHAVGDGHDTALNSAATSTVSLAGSWADQREFRNRSASVNPKPALLEKLPTATQPPLRTHETPPMEIPLLPAGAANC